ncbi:hypothetical protein E2C01_052484 [Portunus trituberculatus]|uniref:Uncharacterized protein n=1 Tax=Portunus trituberculatus TaxID=210409 RepID=A0A5B7GLP4_PORTR|nr:hypothetical protein [Portunus trituberculatus]
METAQTLYNCTTRSTWCCSFYLGWKEHHQEGAHLSSSKSDYQHMIDSDPKTLKIQIYAPQQGCTEEEKEEFLNKLEDNCRINHEETIIMMLQC